MASEYLKWKYKDVKPDPEPVYTKAEKRKNWWDYNLGWVILGVVLVIAAIFLIRDMFFRTKPDYQVGYVSMTLLPDDLRTSLEEQLAALGEDVNGDGKVVVSLQSYELAFQDMESLNPQMFTANTTRLAADMGQGEMFIVLLADPQGFQSYTGLLSYLDGTAPPEDQEGYGSENWKQMAYAWSDCPVLKGLDLGTYEQDVGLETEERDAQAFLEDLYVARRVIVGDRQAEKYAPDLALWEKLTAGAAPLS